MGVRLDLNPFTGWTNKAKSSLTPISPIIDWIYPIFPRIVLHRPSYLSHKWSLRASKPNRKKYVARTAIAVIRIPLTIETLKWSQAWFFNHSVLTSTPAANFRKMVWIISKDEWKNFSPAYSVTLLSSNRSRQGIKAKQRPDRTAITAKAERASVATLSLGSFT